MRWLTFVVVVTALAVLSACGEPPAEPVVDGETAPAPADPTPAAQSSDPAGPPTPTAEPSEPPAQPSEPPAEEQLDVVPVLFVHATLDDDALEQPELVWNAVAADELAQREAAMAGIDGQGTATLTGADGQLLAEAPAEVVMDSQGGTSAHTHFLVPDGAEHADQLRIVLDDGPELVVEREDDVVLERLDLPEPGPLDLDATATWEASSGTVEGRWLVGSGDPAFYDRSGTTDIGGASLPADGGWLLVVAFDGLAFDLEVAGPYLHPDGGASPVEWQVFFDGEDIDTVGTVEVDARDSPWHARVDAIVMPPGGADVHPDEIDATWSSDLDGDLAGVNLEQAPTLWVEVDDLTAGEHVWTLHLEADLPDGSRAEHEVELEVRVGG